MQKEGKLDAENHKVDWTVTVTPNVWAEPESEDANKLLDHIHSLVVTDDLVDLGAAFTLDEASLNVLTIFLKKNTTEEQTVEYDTRFRDESTLTVAEKADLAAVRLGNRDRADRRQGAA